MAPETLDQIDQELIKLLGKRIALLRESELSECSEKGFDRAPLLEQTGVPEFVWENFTTSCAAASTATSSSSTPVTPRQVTVIGGGGKMGQFFTRQLSTAGHHVRILEPNDWEHADQLLGNAELVLICVPTEHAVTVIEKASQYLAPDTALADITSIKTPIVEAMLEQHSGPVLSLHPMFGPGTDSFLSQNVVACPARTQEAFQWLLDLLESRGGKVTVCTPQEHDQMMGIIQAIRHFSTFSLGVFLAEEGIDINQSLEFSSPLYRLKVDMVSRLFAQDSSLPLGIMLHAEEHRQAISRLATTYSRLAQLVSQKDYATLRQEFESTRGVFEQETTRALTETNYVIDSLSVLLAAADSQQKDGQKT